jgi:predicted lipid-binding transport protein (Tim44 family)
MNHMKRHLLSVFAAFLGCALLVGQADAGRLGGGRSIGAQRSVTPSKPAQQAAPQNAPQQQPVQAANGGSRWGGILGGLAIGGLLGYLFGGGGLVGVALLALLAIGAVLAFRAMARSASQGAPQRAQYAGMQRQETMPASFAGAAQETSRARVPPGFDADAFLKAAKMNFIRLQAAHDRGSLDELREVMTDELFEELRHDIRGADQHTDVAALRADLLELATEGDRHWASVHFSGMVRDAPDAAPAGFEEVWNLVKPADGSSGWLLAGIQQMH